MCFVGVFPFDLESCEKLMSTIGSTIAVFVACTYLLLLLLFVACMLFAIVAAIIALLFLLFVVVVGC